MNDVIRPSNPVDVTRLLAFVRQTGFSKRYRFYRALQDRIAVKLDDPSIVPAWPDALNLVNDEDWATAYHAVFGDVALPLVQSSDETGVVLSPQERHAVHNALQFFEEYRKGYTPFIDPTMVALLKRLDEAHELKASEGQS